MRRPILAIAISLWFCKSAYSETIIATNLSGNDTHCSGDETSYFNCKIKGSSIVASVCGKGFNYNEGKSGYLQYRFGKIGKIEIAFPELVKADVIKDQFFYVSEGNSEGFHTKLSFTNGGYIYQLNHATGKEEQSGKSESYEVSSIYVAKSGAKNPQTVLICTNKTAGEGLVALYPVVPLMSSPGGKWLKSFL